MLNISVQISQKGTEKVKGKGEVVPLPAMKAHGGAYV
jgi:hypothetical protein